MIKRIKDYWPLIMVFILSLLMALALQISGKYDATFMNLSMGFFLCLLSLFKLFDIKAFAEGFQMYDLLAGQIQSYAFLYPFIELGLGLSYLAQTAAFATNLITLIVMTVSLCGVLQSIRAGLDIRCACLGTVLKVPLSTVSVVENLLMAIMAAINLLLLI